MPSPASACAAPGSSASEVAEPVKAICPGAVLTVAVPMRRPRANAVTPNALDVLGRGRGLPRVGTGGFYEVWMMRDATHLVALGSFRVGADGRARVDLPVTASPRRFPVLDISREAADGDPAHSGHSVLRSRPIDS
jgi:anti-sigma-K factor RskA